MLATNLMRARLERDCGIDMCEIHALSTSKDGIVRFWAAVADGTALSPHRCADLEAAPRGEVEKTNWRVATFLVPI